MLRYIAGLLHPRIPLLGVAITLLVSTSLITAGQADATEFCTKVKLIPGGTCESGSWFESVTVLEGWITGGGKGQICVGLKEGFRFSVPPHCGENFVQVGGVFAEGRAWIENPSSNTEALTVSGAVG